MKSLEFHPAKERPRTALFLAFAFGILLQFLWNTLSHQLAVAIWILSLASLRDFFLPTNYLFEEGQLVIVGPLKPRRCYPWTRFRTFISDRNGLFLSPYRQKRSSESRRGIFLPLLPNQRESVKEICLGRGLEARPC